jgi:hypothetical protein
MKKVSYTSAHGTREEAVKLLAGVQKMPVPLKSCGIRRQANCKSSTRRSQVKKSPAGALDQAIRRVTRYKTACARGRAKPVAASHAA